jgi:hypothetical protein
MQAQWVEGGITRWVGGWVDARDAAHPSTQQVRGSTRTYTAIDLVNFDSYRFLE